MVLTSTAIARARALGRLRSGWRCFQIKRELKGKRKGPMFPSWIFFWVAAQNEPHIASWRMLVIAAASVITLSTAAGVLATYLL